MHSPVALIPQLAGHIVAAGGKRLRPMLTLACARLCGYRGERHIALAAAVEFIHTATLLHDDVVDASDLRRGRDTANAVWGNKPAVLVGDFLFSRVVRADGRGGSLRVLEILSRAAAVIAEGEVLQLVTAERHDNDRGRLSRGHRGEDSGAVRRGGAHRRGRRRPPGGRRGGARRASAAISASPFSWSTTCSIFRRARAELGKSRRRRFPRRQDHAADRDRLCPRRCRGARNSGGARSKSSEQRAGRSRTRDRPRRAPRRARRDAGAGARLRRRGDRALGAFSDGRLARRALVEVAGFRHRSARF